MYILGFSISAVLTTTSFDIFVISCDKNSGTINWIRRLGTPNFSEYSRGLAVYPVDGSVFMTGTTNSVDIS